MSKTKSVDRSGASGLLSGKGHTIVSLFGSFIDGIRDGQLHPVPPMEFHVLDWAECVRDNYDPRCTDMAARDMLRPFEESGKIKYTGMLRWRIARQRPACTRPGESYEQNERC